jgi:hypothetical protein
MSMSEQQKPSVGRVVHYVAYGTPGGEFPAGVCRAAIVTEVPPPQGNPAEPDVDLRVVASLCVLNPTGQYFNPAVPYHEGEMVHGKRVLLPGTWHWPERV